jgi:alpha-beta hydrolase superfamily lysophospholipase
LDLRKCGRSIISPEQDSYKHYFSDISEYNEEVTLAIEYMIGKASDRERKLILYGHSTGNTTEIKAK